tara:strand:+ start:31579 stop:32376 length:798 start_codon:yes stop_codon:yes gene_type:complete
VRTPRHRAIALAGFGVAVLLLAAGVGLVGLAAITPWHTDSDAYFAGLAAIQRGLSEVEGASYQVASAAFHALQDQYRTLKWVYADFGYSALAWGVLFLGGAAARWSHKGPMSSRSGILVSMVTLAGLGLLFTGLLASSLQLYHREQLPPWADTLGIPLFGAVATIVVLGPVIAVLTLSPVLFTRRRPAPLFSVRGRGWLTSIIVSLIYLLPLAGAVVLLLSVAETGGWAASIAGVLLGWALLNARATWLGHRPAAMAKTPAESGE